jgi:polygalacturonase
MITLRIREEGRDVNITKPANTDGMDTIDSSHIKFDNWTVYNGDDCLSLKGNSTDITITNSYLHTGLGIAIGSAGQYYGEFENIERLLVENVTFENTVHTVSALIPRPPSIQIEQPI